MIIEEQLRRASIDLELWRALLAQVSFRAWFPITVEADVDLRACAVVITSKLDVPDIDGRGVGNFNSAHPPEGLIDGPSGLHQALRWLRAHLQTHVLHELDECTLFNGRAAHDPHIALREVCPDHRGMCRITVVRNNPRRQYACTTDSTPRDA